MSFICKRDSKKYCMACEHYEDCDRANRCNGDCKNCDDSSCENNKFFHKTINNQEINS